MLDNFIIQLFHEGKCTNAYEVFGAHLKEENGKKGVRFTVYAPNAKGVQVIGDFNHWNGQGYDMQRYYDGGIWTLFVEGVREYSVYKYRIQTASGTFVEKADPYAFFSELRPQTGSKVFNLEDYPWHDGLWMKRRTRNFDKKVNIYEMHLGSWKFKVEGTKEKDGVYYSYEEMVNMVIPYVKANGYSHIEIMPLLEHPFDGSWGYQTTGFFSATSRYGNPKQLMYFIDSCHKAGIGVIIDFVPAHFVKDAHGLHEFDGGQVYEYPDVNRRYTEWDSCYFDLGREEVRSFLISSSAFWLKYFHFDGIRYDAISNLIFWKGNKQLGLNHGAVEFMRRNNSILHDLYPSVMLIAEDSSDYQGVTKHASVGGLGFDYKWDLGWMNDTLKYMEKDPIYRKDFHHLITFSMAYFYGENFILPFSHDEVVHGKKTIIDKMFGTYEQKMAQVKTLYLYMYAHPGKKLNFMGNELAEYKEWDEAKSLGWNILDYPVHDAFHRFRRKLNEIYNDYPCMYQYDYYWEGFRWTVVDDRNQSVFAIIRHAPKGHDLLFVMNFAGGTHRGYYIPVLEPGEYTEILNTDHESYTGNGMINAKTLVATQENLEIGVDIAPFSGMIFDVKKKRKGKGK